MDEFFKRIKREIDKGITVVSVKSKELIDNAKLNTEIADLNDQRKQTLMAIGEIVYLMSQQPEFDGEGAITEKCKRVAEVEQRIAACELELRKLRPETPPTEDRVSCESCGATSEFAAKFCSSCGAKLEKDEPPVI